MIELSIKEIVDITKGTLYGNDELSNFTAVCTDTRKVQKGDIFIAFKGDNFNANEYIDKALSSGASLCIVDELHFDVNNLDKNNAILLVDNVFESLGLIAKYYIKKVNVKVIGVTGSCGKTSTKDMIAAVLSNKYKVLKTIGNFNNGIGLPLTILRLNSSYDVAILEMGMSNAKEIEYLADIARPDISVITNIGLSHIENLGSQENILKAKMESTAFFGENNLLVLNGDDSLLNTISSKEYRVSKVGVDNKGDIYVENLNLMEYSSNFNVVLDNEIVNCTIDMPGKHNVINFLLSLAIAKELGVSINDALDGLKNIEKTSMRLDFKKHNGYTLINDCYNSSPDSVKSAVDVQMNLNGKRNIVVLGPMYELGDMSNKCHYDIGQYISSKNVDKVFATGEYTNEYKKALGDKCFYFENKELLIESLKDYIAAEDVILIKASRGAHFETIYNSLL